jgi:ubiquinone/menaquinone biosynthesis C-methylase UbiE
MAESSSDKTRSDSLAMFRNKTDQEWCELLERSVTEEFIEGVRFPRFPADSLQSQFVGSANSSALREAMWFYKELKQQSRSAGAPLELGSTVLDFGCGWGRYLRFFWKDVREEGLYGVDVDPDILQLCKTTGVPGQLSPIDPRGKLPFENAFFTHAMAYSVFTHLPENIHLHWMNEIARVLKPGATFTLTLEPRRFLDFVADQEKHSSVSEWHKAMARFAQSVPEFKSMFDAGKVVYLPTGGGDYRGTDTYGDAAVPLGFIKQHWSGKFEVLDYIDDAQKYWQAVLVVRRRID